MSGSRRPRSRPPSCSRAASGESTDIVRKEMFTFEDGGGRSLTLRPEGTAPVCRAYVEHGMHKRRQPVKLWYLSSFFRHERAQAGRYRQFWQVGAEALGSEDPAVDAESIALLAALLAEMGVREVRLRLSSLGSPESRARVSRAAAGISARERSEPVRGRARADRAEPAARVRLRPRGHAPRDGRARRACSTSSSVAGRRALRAGARAAGRGRASRYEVDSTLVRGLDYYTRTVFEFTSDALGAQSGVGGGGRYDGLVERLGGRPTPGMGWAAGVERMLLAGEPPADRRRRRWSCSSRSTARAPRRAGVRPAGGGPLGGAARADGSGGRSLKGQLGHADALGARYVAIVEDGATVLKDMQDGRTGADRDGHGRARGLARAAHAVSAPGRRRATRVTARLQTWPTPSKRFCAVQLWPAKCRSRGQ